MFDSANNLKGLDFSNWSEKSMMFTNNTFRETYYKIIGNITSEQSMIYENYLEYHGDKDLDGDGIINDIEFLQVSQLDD